MKKLNTYTLAEIKNIATPLIEQQWYEEHNDDSCDTLADQFDDLLQQWLDDNEFIKVDVDTYVDKSNYDYSNDELPKQYKEISDLSVLLKMNHYDLQTLQLSLVDEVKRLEKSNKYVVEETLAIVQNRINQLLGLNSYDAKTIKELCDLFNIYYTTVLVKEKAISTILPHINSAISLCEQYGKNKTYEEVKKLYDKELQDKQSEQAKKKFDIKGSN